MVYENENSVFKFWCVFSMILVTRQLFVCHSHSFFDKNNFFRTNQLNFSIMCVLTIFLCAIPYIPSFCWIRIEQLYLTIPIKPIFRLHYRKKLKIRNKYRYFQTITLSQSKCNIDFQNHVFHTSRAIFWHKIVMENSSIDFLGCLFYK